MALDLEAIKARDTALRPDGEAWSCRDCDYCSSCAQLLPCDRHAEGDEVLVLVAEVERLREQVARGLPTFCSCVPFPRLRVGQFFTVCETCLGGRYVDSVPATAGPRFRVDL